ncbi:YrdB family protein [Streptomyces lasalocidi]
MPELVGFAVGDDAALHVLFGLGTPLAAVALWGLFAAPKARLRPRLPLVLAVKAVVLGGGAAALYAVGHPAGAVAMAVAVTANTAVAELFRRRAAALSHQGLTGSAWLSRHHAHSASANDTPTNTAPRLATTLATTLATA